MNVVQVSNTLGANTAVLGELFKHPLQDLLVYSLKPEDLQPRTDIGVATAQKQSTPVKETVVASHFNLIFLSAQCLTVGLLLLDVVLVILLHSPDANEQTVITGVDSTWKAGAGAILGLVGGKVT